MEFEGWIAEWNKKANMEVVSTNEAHTAQTLQWIGPRPNSLGVWTRTEEDMERQVQK